MISIEEIKTDGNRLCRIWFQFFNKCISLLTTSSIRGNTWKNSRFNLSKKIEIDHQWKKFQQKKKYWMNVSLSFWNQRFKDDDSSLVIDNHFYWIISLTNRISNVREDVKNSWLDIFMKISCRLAHTDWLIVVR